MTDSVGHPFVTQPECLELTGGPPVRRRVRRFADQGQPAGSQKTCRPARRDEWGTEAPCRDDIECTSVRCRELRHISGTDLRPEAEGSDGPLEKICSSLPPFDQHDGQIWAAISDDQTGETTAGSEIDHSSRTRRQGSDEPVRVRNGGVERGRPDGTVRLQ